MHIIKFDYPVILERMETPLQGY